MGDQVQDDDSHIRCPICKQLISCVIFEEHLPYCRWQRARHEPTFVCPYNSMHVVSESEQEFHLAHCPERQEHLFQRLVNPDFSPTSDANQTNGIVPNADLDKPDGPDDSTFNSFPPPALDFDTSMYDDDPADLDGDVSGDEDDPEDVPLDISAYGDDPEDVELNVSMHEVEDDPE